MPLENAARAAIPTSGQGVRLTPVHIDHLWFQSRRIDPMAKMMTKTQVAAHIATKFEVTKKTGTAILEELAMLAAKQAKNGFVFPGVGKLVVVNRKARMGRNPQTGEAIKIPAKRVLKFRIAKAMKDAVLK